MTLPTEHARGQLQAFSPQWVRGIGRTAPRQLCGGRQDVGVVRVSGAGFARQGRRALFSQRAYLCFQLLQPRRQFVHGLPLGIG